jgi:predicted HAD superfamily Cof-like phosphohydrolase
MATKTTTTSSKGKTNFEKVQDFNRAFDMVAKEPARYTSGYIDELDRQQRDEYQHIRPQLFTETPKIIRLRLDLIKEEIGELNQAIETNDFIETRDALADILYVVYGMADVLGINIDTAFRNSIQNYNRIDNGLKIFEGVLKYANKDETNGKPFGLTNFDWVRIINDINNGSSDGDIVSDNLKLIQKYINENYTKLEEYCLSPVEKNREAFVKIADYLYNILKWVYTYAYFAKIDANSDFAIVHNSNMSKLCDSIEDAVMTVADYIEKYVSGNSPYDSPYYYELPELGKWIVKNKSTGKALKNIKYKKVDFS